MANQFDVPLKDSGKRAEFQTGAVRDQSTGKGRMDLLPPGVLIQLSRPSEFSDSFNLPYVTDGASAAQFLLLGFMTDFNPETLLESLRHLMFEIELELGANENDFIEYTLDEFSSALIEIAKHFEKGATKYAPRNWEKGMNLSRYYDSALRHLTQYLRGDKDEPHLVAAAWNVACLYQTGLWIQDGVLSDALNDLPTVRGSQVTTSTNTAGPTAAGITRNIQTALDIGDNDNNFSGPVRVTASRSTYNEHAVMLEQFLNKVFVDACLPPYDLYPTPLLRAYGAGTVAPLKQIAIAGEDLEPGDLVSLDLAKGPDQMVYVSVVHNPDNFGTATSYKIIPADSAQDVWIEDYQNAYDEGYYAAIERAITAAVVLDGHELGGYEDSPTIESDITQVLTILAHAHPDLKRPVESLLRIATDFAHTTQERNAAQTRRAKVEGKLNVVHSDIESLLAERQANCNCRTCEVLKKLKALIEA